MNIWDGDIITGTESLLVLLVGEDVLASDHGFSGAVLTWFGGGECSDFAWEGVLQHDEGTWLGSAGFDEMGGGRTSITFLKLV